MGGGHSGVTDRRRPGDRFSPPARAAAGVCWRGTNRRTVRFPTPKCCREVGQWDTEVRGSFSGQSGSRRHAGAFVPGSHTRREASRPAPGGRSTRTGARVRSGSRACNDGECDGAGKTLRGSPNSRTCALNGGHAPAAISDHARGAVSGRALAATRDRACATTVDRARRASCDPARYRTGCHAGRNTSRLGL